MFGLYPGQLEYRQRGRELIGRFPYGKLATVRDRGRVRKERFSRRAFKFAVEDPSRDIDLLAGHSFDRPLATRRLGSLELEETDDGLNFVATLPPESEQPSWVQDTVKAVRGGLARGISPGFRVPPSSAVSNAEELLPEPGNPGVMIRQINSAVLFELSVVTRPAYDETSVELRAAETNLERFYRWL